MPVSVHWCDGRQADLFFSNDRVRLVGPKLTAGSGDLRTLFDTYRAVDPGVEQYALEREDVLSAGAVVATSGWVYRDEVHVGGCASEQPNEQLSFLGRVIFTGDQCIFE